MRERPPTRRGRPGGEGSGVVSWVHLERGRRGGASSLVRTLARDAARPRTDQIRADASLRALSYVRKLPLGGALRAYCFPGLLATAGLGRQKSGAAATIGSGGLLQSGRNRLMVDSVLRTASALALRNAANPSSPSSFGNGMALSISPSDFRSVVT